MLTMVATCRIGGGSTTPTLQRHECARQLNRIMLVIIKPMREISTKTTRARGNLLNSLLVSESSRTLGKMRPKCGGLFRKEQQQNTQHNSPMSRVWDDIRRIPTRHRCESPVGSVCSHVECETPVDTANHSGAKFSTHCILNCAPCSSRELRRRGPSKIHGASQHERI